MQIPVINNYISERPRISECMDVDFSEMREAMGNGTFKETDTWVL
jgi:hypothetical protein